MQSFLHLSIMFWLYMAFHNWISMSSSNFCIFHTSGGSSRPIAFFVFLFRTMSNLWKISYYCSHLQMWYISWEYWYCFNFFSNKYLLIKFICEERKKLPFQIWYTRNYLVNWRSFFFCILDFVTIKFWLIFLQLSSGL